MKKLACDNWEFIDALRAVIGLRPLYRYGGERPCYERRALADMSVAIGDGNRRTPTVGSHRQDERSGDARSAHDDVRELSPRELARLRKQRPLSRGARRLNGQRVGLAFVTLGRRV